MSLWSGRHRAALPPRRLGLRMSRRRSAGKMAEGARRKKIPLFSEKPGREEAYEVLGATQAKRALLEKRSRENEKISVLRGWNASCAMPGGGNETRWAPTAGSEAFGFGNAG